MRDGEAKDVMPDFLYVGGMAAAPVQDDASIPGVELRPQSQARLVGFPADHHRVDRLHEGVHAVKTLGSGTGRQPFQITVRPRDVTIRAGRDVDDDLPALRHEYLATAIADAASKPKITAPKVPMTLRRRKRSASAFSRSRSLAGGDAAS